MLKQTGSVRASRWTFPLTNPDPEVSPAVENDSPYPEVRSAVANYDDPDMPVGTLRAWIIGIIWAMVLPGVNQFFYLRYPTIMVSNVSVFFPFSSILDVVVI